MTKLADLYSKAPLKPNILAIRQYTGWPRK